MQPLVPSVKCACAVLSSVAFPALLYFPTHLIKGHDIKKNLLNVKCVFQFPYDVFG